MAPKGNKKSTKEQLLPAAKNSTPQQNNNNNPPNWPPLKPLIPASDLYLETLLDDQILIIRNLLTSTLSKTYVSFLSSLPLVTTPSRPKKYEAVRVNDRFQVHDPIFAEMLWSSTALKRLVSEEGGDAGADGGAGAGLWGGEVLGLNPNIRIYRYGPGQFFDKHCKSFNFLFIFFSNLFPFHPEYFEYTSQRVEKGGWSGTYILHTA